jgi:hypothetical protein
MAEEEEVPVEWKIVYRHMDELSEMRSELRELEALSGGLYTDAELAELALIDQQMDELGARREVLDAQRRARDEELFETIASAVEEIRHKEAALKAACYGMPTRLLAATQRISHGGLNVTVSTARIERTYRSKAMLQKHPELRKLKVGNYSVVTEEVDAAVLDRLVANDEFSKEDADEFLIETIIKNPSVRIREEEA